MTIGSLEILFCVLVAAVAAGLYGVLVVLLGRAVSHAVRRDGLVLFGLPVLCVVAAVLTPPDMVSLMLLAIPLCALYGLAVGIWLFIRYRKPRGEPKPTNIITMPPCLHVTRNAVGAGPRACPGSESAPLSSSRPGRSQWTAPTGAPTDA